MSDKDLNSLFSTLESQVNQLNSAAESANTELERAQQRLASLNIAIEIWHTRPLERSDVTGGIQLNEISTEIISLLGYAKVDSKWCLAIKKVRCESGFYEGDMNCPFTNKYLESPPTPLLSQSRSLRLNALATIPTFLEEIAEHVNNLLEELPKSKAKLHAV